MKKALLVLAVLLTASCGHSDDGHTKEILPADEASSSAMSLGAQAWVSEDQRQVEIMTLGGVCDESAEIRVSETARKVRVVLRVTTSNETCILLGVTRSFQVKLREPLGDRALVGGNGRPYPRLKERPGKASNDIPVKVVDDD